MPKQPAAYLVEVYDEIWDNQADWVARYLSDDKEKAKKMAASIQADERTRNFPLMPPRIRAIDQKEADVMRAAGIFVL